MKPVNPAFEDDSRQSPGQSGSADDLSQLDSLQAGRKARSVDGPENGPESRPENGLENGPESRLNNRSDDQLGNQLDNRPTVNSSELGDLGDIQLSGLADSPLERLKLRYAKQLTKDIERLEAEKAALQAAVDDLKADRDRLIELGDHPLSQSNAGLQLTQADAAEVTPIYLEGRNQPRLPGESKAATSISAAQRPDTPLELPIPSTSEQRRQNAVQIQRVDAEMQAETLRRGLILSAIATFLIAWHYGLVATLGQGGSWLGISIGQLGTGFVPAVALLWLRMLVIVPALVFLAPQLYKNTWVDLQTLFYTRHSSLEMLSQRAVLLMMGSGIALFLSQALIYQSIGLVGAPIGATLLFLYPLTAISLGAVFSQENKMTPVGLLAVVAIAMGGLLAVRPVLAPALQDGLEAGFQTASAASHAVWLGALASVCFSFYIVMTNLAYRQQCHPVPTAIVQFSVVAVLSSFVLLLRPLELVDISWLSFSLWGVVLGAAMLLVYLLSYGSLRLIGPKTGAIAASVPLVALVIAWCFTPRPSLEIIQWTGILLVSVGGIALGSEKGKF